MIGLIVPIDPSRLARNGLCASAAKWFERSGGRIDAEPGSLARIWRSAHVSVVKSQDYAPYFAFIGPDSPAVKVYGQEWANRAIGAPGLPDPRAEALCNKAYYDVALTGQPSAHYCRATFRVDEKAATLVYNRVLLPLKTPRAVMVMSIADLLPGSCIGDPQPSSIQTNRLSVSI